MDGKKHTKRIEKWIGVILLLCVVWLAGCGRKDENMMIEEPAEERIVVGFSQLGAESDWRSSNTKSMRSTLTAGNGYELIFDDGQQKQSNQITAIRKFIQQEVDYIVLAPVTEKGWDTVLQEAKDARIPVIIVDRMVDVEDESLFTCWVGSDFELEGKKVAEWFKQFTLMEGIAAEDICIANIQGTIGASAQIGRTKGLEEASKENGWRVLAEVPGDFNQAKGREAMTALLEQYPEINVVYCENDNEAFGAIEAIEAAGRTVGWNIVDGEILVLSFDAATEKALDYVKDGRIGSIAECNPLHGPRVQAIIEMLEAGEIPEKFSYVDEVIYSSYPNVQEIIIDEVVYQVEILVPEEKTEEIK